MKIPLSWLREYVTVPEKLTAEQIAQAFVKVGFEVEQIEYQGKDLKGPLLVGKVLSIEELSGHKKPIRYVGLDLGDKKTRFVICGARNFKVNDLVVVAVPGAVLPGNFAISARETYGKVSDGIPQKVHSVQKAGSPVESRPRGAVPATAGVMITS